MPDCVLFFDTVEKNALVRSENDLEETVATDIIVGT